MAVNRFDDALAMVNFPMVEQGTHKPLVVGSNHANISLLIQRVDK